MKTFAGKNIWIIGASSGIGRALAIELAARGATLILSARRAAALEELNRELGGRHFIHAMDAARHEDFCALVQKIPQDIPKLDSAIFMAAIYVPHSGERKNINLIHEMMHVNLGGAFNMVDAVHPYFTSHGGGQIVLCGSVAGYRGLPTGQPYCAAKAALINLAESLKIEMEGENIDVKIINPGFVRTPLTDKNDFAMPMIIEADAAAKAIANGLVSKAFEIHFPKRFTWMMKALRLLPTPLYFWAARKMHRRTTENLAP